MIICSLKFLDDLSFKKEEEETMDEFVYMVSGKLLATCIYEWGDMTDHYRWAG